MLGKGNCDEAENKFQLERNGKIIAVISKYNITLSWLGDSTDSKISRAFFKQSPALAY